MPLPISLREIEYVVAVADAGSTAGGARLANVSQPSVSAAVKRVEDALAQPLFLRSAGVGMGLTPFGVRKLAEFRRLLDQARTVLKRAGDDAEDGELDLGVLTTLAAFYVPGLLRAVKHHYPRATLRIHEGNLQEITTWLRDGKVELAMLYDVGAHQDLTITAMRDVRPYGLVPAGHPLSGCSHVTLAELLRDPLILIDLPQSREYFLSLIQMQGLVPTIGFETKSLEMVRSMVANGFGVGLLATELPYRTTYDSREVVHLPLAGPLPPHGIALARATRLPPTRFGRAVEDIAAHFLNDKVGP
jgi:DNA-binding transcriptional LysR family regulator